MKHLTIAGIVIGLFLLYASTFTVAEYEYAAKFKLGAIVETDYTPGLHWQIPIVNNVVKFDRRIQSLDASAERFITFEKKDVIVDSFVKWRIADVRNYYRATGGDRQRAQLRLAQIIADGLRTEFSTRTLEEVVSTEREEIMQNLAVTANDNVRSLGIEVVDVRVKKIELPREVERSVFERMAAERSEVANKLRSEGSKEKQIIQAAADRQARVIVATAERASQLLHGEGDAEAASQYAQVVRIAAERQLNAVESSETPASPVNEADRTRLYDQAYERNREFFAFYRSLQAYRSAFGSNDLILLDSNSEFFEYFDRQHLPPSE